MENAYHTLFAFVSIKLREGQEMGQERGRRKGRERQEAGDGEKEGARGRGREGRRKRGEGRGRERARENNKDPLSTENVRTLHSIMRCSSQSTYGFA